MAKRGYVKKKKATSINEKSTQKVSQTAEKDKMPKAVGFSNLALSQANEASKRMKPSGISKVSRIEEEAKRKVLSILGPASKVDELAEQLAVFRTPQSNIDAFSGLGSAIRADELAKQLGISGVSLSDLDIFSDRGPLNQLDELAKHTIGEINPSQFGKLVRAEEELREHVFSNLGSTIQADEFAEQQGISGISLSVLDALSGLGPASQLDELTKLTATGISLNEFEKLAGVEEALRKNAFSQFCSEDQSTEIAKQLGRLGTSSIFSTEEEARKFARLNLGIGISVNEFIQWKKSQGPWIEDEEVAKLVDNLSGENPDLDKAEEWLESNRDKLTPETLTTMIKTAMERGVSDYLFKLGNKRHAENRALSTEIKGIWAGGKYSSRNICASEEWRSLGFNSEKTARNALNNTPDPSPWPAEGM